VSVLDTSGIFKVLSPKISVIRAGFHSPTSVAVRQQASLTTLLAYRQAILCRISQVRITNVLHQVYLSVVRKWIYNDFTARKHCRTNAL